MMFTMIPIMNATKGDTKEISIERTAVVVIVRTDAFLVIATQPTLSPYVAFGQPPKIAPVIEPTQSPRRVLEFCEELIYDGTCTCTEENCGGCHSVFDHCGNLYHIIIGLSREL